MELKRQRGMTFIGLLMTASVLGVLVVSGLNILPLYLQDQKMGTIFRSLEKDGEGNMSRADIVKFIQNRMDINQIERDEIDLGNLRVESTPGNGKRVTLEYEARGHLLANLDAVASFRHEVVIR